MPVLVDAVAYFSPLIRQMENPTEDICLERARDFFGEGWADTFTHRDSSAHVSRKDVEKRRTEVKDLQKRLKTAMEEGVVRLGFPSKTSNTSNNFVLAASLHPDRHVIKKLVEHMEKTREADPAKSESEVRR